MPGMFFTSWDLWQQMTFVCLPTTPALELRIVWLTLTPQVLAMAIVAVFCAGLGKLWWNNRLMKKQEALDEEKRARVEEIRKTGLPMKRGNQVPFGVRAIQSGVEVDGIWISRPASLNELGEKLGSSTTLGRDSDSQKKRQDYSEDEKSVLVNTTNLDRSGPKQSPSTASIFQKLTDTDSTESTHSAAPPVSQFAHSKPRRQSSRPTASGTLNEDTLRRLEGHSPSQPPYGTYVPTSPPRRLNPRSSASSSADSVDSPPHSSGGASGRSYASSSHSSRLYIASRPTAAATTTTPGRSGHDAAQASPSALRRWSEKDGRVADEPDPFATPRTARTPSGFSAFSMMSETASASSAHRQVGQPQQQQQQQQEMAVPEPTFGPGDLHYNRGVRRS
jgi:hypothetical protein